MDNRGRDSPINVGCRAEDRALRFLEDAGLILLARNFRCRLGEVDLIMQEGNAIVFVEVRKRRNSRFGTAAESVSTSKLRRIRAAAALWLRVARRNNAARLDVVTMDGDDVATARIGWIRGADG
jgi:putative endonuclease